MWRRKFLRLLCNSYSNSHYITNTIKYENVCNVTLGHLKSFERKYTNLVDEHHECKAQEVRNESFNSFTYRTHTCGELQPADNGKKVTLCGWIQYIRLSKFLILRDSYGMTQCLINNSVVQLNDLPLETVVKIDGEVTLRPINMINAKMSTGKIEVIVEKIDILNKADNVPFNLRDYQKPKEQLRLQNRYVDLRVPEMQNNLRTRSSMLHNMRKFLIEEHGFVEVETPTLFCRTPGGAREFIVPTRHSGLFYSLVQSPQQFKQMLMAGGLDRYFQVARCYRDETTRPDRQPEFTQLDIELSYTSLDNIINLIENLIYNTFTKQLPRPPYTRMSYKYALQNYGTDKPNTTYDLRLINITKLFSEMDTCVYALPYPSKLGKLTAKYKEKINNIRKKYGLTIIYDEKITKELSNETDHQIRNITGDNSCIIAMGDNDQVCLCLGEIRELLKDVLQSQNLIKVKDNIEPIWVVDFPLFLKGNNGLETCHHPFTAPHPDDLHMLTSDPLKVRSLSYDIVMNGNEVGGGSVRVHNANLQEKLLRMLNIDSDKLSHFLKALRSGCPPHAGLALGIDRLTALACKAESIRDVIAFPKSHEGKDPLSGAPNVITEDDKQYYHIDILK